MLAIVVKAKVEKSVCKSVFRGGVATRGVQVLYMQWLRPCCKPF